MARDLLRLLLCSLSVVMLLFIAASSAAPDPDKIQALAQQRYGARATETIAAWRALIQEVNGLSDIEKLNKTNTFFNRRILYASDLAVWQQEDYWASPLELVGRGSGDCEDYAIAKYITLQMMGINNQHLRMIYVRAKTGASTVAHMVMGYYAQPTEEPMILDNLISSVRPASQRADLAPVFSFNSDGLWAGAATVSSSDPTARLSRWRDVLERMRQDGF